MAGVQADRREVGYDRPSAAVELGYVAERLLHRRQPAVGCLLGVQVGGGGLQLDDGPRDIAIGPEVAESAVRGFAASGLRRGGFSFEIVVAQVPDGLRIAEQDTEHLPKERALQWFLVLLGEIGVGGRGRPVVNDLALLVGQLQREASHPAGQKMSVE